MDPKFDAIPKPSAAENLPVAEVVHSYDEVEGIVQVTTHEEEQYAKQETENRKSFVARLEGLPEEKIRLIDFAYDLSKEAHRPQRRDTGERYFEHLRSVAIILLDECKMNDPDMICASLLHDSVEDSAIFGNARRGYTIWKEVVRFRIAKVFNPEVAEMVISLTKPKVDGEEIQTKDEAHHIYIEHLAESPAKTILIKMADRLHNLRSLPGTTLEKQKKIVKETREIYIPLFQKVLTEYPKEGQYMLDEMEKAMTVINVG